MRLWHERLIPNLPRQQLLGQHRECAALRGNGWGKKHETVDYVFTYSPAKLFQYHHLIMLEMERRDYQPDPLWLDPCYRGKQAIPYSEVMSAPLTTPIYPEHDDTYLAECLQNLAEKGAVLYQHPS